MGSDLPIKELPNSFNPPEGYIATANENNVPHGYPYRLGYSWTDPFRFNRIAEVLSSGRRFTMTDMMLLQHDELSIPARTLVPLLQGLDTSNRRVRQARDLLLDWDFVMDKNSVPAAVFSAWRSELSAQVRELVIPEEYRDVAPGPSTKKMIDFLTAPDGSFGPHPIEGRDQLLLTSLEEGVEQLTERLGPDMNSWQYGQEDYHHIRIRHMLSNLVNDELRSRLDVGPRPRGGSGNTVNNTGSGYNQGSGASFRFIVDTSDWDNSVGTNNPGQSGDPDDPHYRDLFELWIDVAYFPLFFSRDKIESVTETVTLLSPAKDRN